MPRATVSRITERKDLTTLLPVDAADGVEAQEGGWVELRRMSYGEKIAKDAEAMKMRFGMDEAAAGNMNAEVAMISEKVTLLEFQRCIMDHNLEDENGKKLDFKKYSDVQSLDPRVGDEISSLIGEMNDFKTSTEEQRVDAKGK